MDGEYNCDGDNSWGRTTSWEEQLLDEVANERDVIDQQSKLEQEAGAQQLWSSFQNSASAVANLYKGMKVQLYCSFLYHTTYGTCLKSFHSASLSG